jgi:hypothetical protein
MDKMNFRALRTLFNDQRIERDGKPEDGQEEPRLLNEQELWLAAGGDDAPQW